MNEKILTPDQRVRVFVGSSLKELQPERKAVKKAINNDLKLHAIMFEAGASPYPPKERYRAFLKQSHIYLGIFWESYGWIAPDMEISGVEDEYQTAKQRNLPKLVYLKNTTKGRDERLNKLIRKIEEEGEICYQPFDTPEELADLVKNDVAHILSERFGVESPTRAAQVSTNYLHPVMQDLSRYWFVERPEMLSKIEKVLKSDKKILLFGEPGCGKTFLLGKIGMRKNGIYISIRGKTSLHVYTYLTNHLRIGTGRLPEMFTNKEEARLDLENSLQNSKKTLLIDDVDQNINLARSLMVLDCYENQAIFAARSEAALGGYPLRRVLVQPFTQQEIKVYFRQKHVKFPPGKFLELLRACHGNPLYLYYFLHFQIDPLPDGLRAYQDALWRELNPTQRELLGLIGISLFPLRINLLCDAHNKLGNTKYSGMEIGAIITGLSSIIRVINGYYEVFHPYFKEAVASQVNHLGLSQTYHRILGEINFSNHRIVEATYHFKKAQDERAGDHLLEAAQIAFLWGLWDIAEEFLRHQVEIAQTKNASWTEGYTRYQLGFLLRDKGLLEEGKIQTQKAIEAFKTCGDRAWIRFAKIQQYCDWIFQGKGMIAIDALKEQLDVYEGVDSINEAMVLLNLSYAYIQVSHFEKGAEVAKKAYGIFAEERNYQGLIASLVNLTACLGQLEKYDLSRKYAEEMIGLAEERGQPRLKAAGLNHLALSLRKSGDAAGACKCLEEAIDICQRLGLIHGEIMNILNLGNAYRDQDDLTNAEKCYQEGLAKATEYDLKKEVGRALELMSRIRRRREDYTGAVTFATKAIEIQRETGDSLRIAESLTERAAVLLSLGENRNSAEDYEEAGNHYRAVSKFNDSITCYERASCQWARLGAEEKALAALEKAIEYAFQGDKVDVAMSSIEELQSARRTKGLDAFYLRVIEQYVKVPSKANLALSLCSFASYCKVSETKEIRNSFVKALKILAEHASEHRNICNTLIAGIEQADERLLMVDEFEQIVTPLTEDMNGFYYRRMPEEITIWTAVWQLDQPITFQIQCLSERLVEKRLSLILMLTVLANKEPLCQTIEELSGFKTNSITFMMLGQQEFEEKIRKMPNGALVNERPVAITQSNVAFTEEQPPIMIILHNNYATFADLSLYPENKALVWLMMNFYTSIMEHITHKRREMSLAKRAREFCEGILGYKEVDVGKSGDAQIQWQIEDIKSVIKRLQKPGRSNPPKNEGDQNSPPSDEGVSSTVTLNDA